MTTLASQVEQVKDMLRIAHALRAQADPLISGQVDGVIGRLTTLLVVMGEVLPENGLGGDGYE